jgi:hypothetical protein
MQPLIAERQDRVTASESVRRPGRLKSETGRATRGLEFVRLGPDDVEEVFALHSLCLSLSPHGYLTPRTRYDYEALLSDSENVFCTGFRNNGRLVAHSTCHRVTSNPYWENPVLAAIDPATRSSFQGDGTVVHPDHRKRRLASQLLRRRHEEMAAHGIDQIFYLIAIDNFASINLLFPGVLLVGFMPDETAMNYIVYGGKLRANVHADEQAVMVDWRDHARQQQLFEERCVVDDLILAAESRHARDQERCRFAFVPIG